MVDNFSELSQMLGMAKSRTNHDGYLAVISSLEKQGHKFPMARLAKMLDVKRQFVHGWHGVIPEGQALRVSILTGVPIETIRPETVAAAIQRKKDLASEETQARENA